MNDVLSKGKRLPIVTEYIRLDAAMKLCSAVSSGGEAKVLVQEGAVTVNGEVCRQRGRKLRKGDVFALGGRQWAVDRKVICDE